MKKIINLVILICFLVTPVKAMSQTIYSNGVEITLKQISNRSLETSNIAKIELNYNNYKTNIIIEPAIDNKITLNERFSIDDQRYISDIVQSGDTLTINQSTTIPSGYYDSETRLYIPANYNGTIVIKNIGNLKIVDMTGLAFYDIVNNKGVVSFSKVTANSIKVSSPFNGVLTMSDVISNVDIAVIGTIAINDSIVSGMIKGDDGIQFSNIVLNLLALNGNLNIENDKGIVCTNFPSNAKFNIDVKAYSVNSDYPNGNFNISNNSIKGSNGNSPYTLVVNSNTFLLSEINK